MLSPQRNNSQARQTSLVAFRDGRPQSSRLVPASQFRRRQREQEALREQRAIYAAQALDEPKPAELEGLAARWKSGDAGQRWELLNALFERLHVKHRNIYGYTPRGDRASRVALLLSTARDYIDGDGPGARVSGKGGIRTLEGALHPLPA
jgi:hypothetical protein